MRTQHLNKRPKRERRRKIQAFTLLDSLVVGLALFFIAVGLFLFQLSQAKAVAPRINCVNNLKQIELAFRIWAGDNGDQYPMQTLANRAGLPALTDTNSAWRYFQVLSNELTRPGVLSCPSDAGRGYATNFADDFNNRSLSYFVGLTVRPEAPGLMLAGDRNLAASTLPTNGQLHIGTNETLRWSHDIHKRAGNIAQTDGSVTQLGSGTPANRFGGNNWLLFP